MQVFGSELWSLLLRLLLRKAVNLRLLQWSSPKRERLFSWLSLDVEDKKSFMCQQPLFHIPPSSYSNSLPLKSALISCEILHSTSHTTHGPIRWPVSWQRWQDPCWEDVEGQWCSEFRVYPPHHFCPLPPLPSAFWRELSSKLFVSCQNVNNFNKLSYITGEIGCLSVPSKINYIAVKKTSHMNSWVAQTLP